jgi:hypothetical protein
MIAVDHWQPQTWKGFSLGVIVGGLCVGMTLLRTPAVRNPASSSDVHPAEARSEAARRVRAFREDAGMSTDDERKLRAVLADGQETWKTAAAYFAALEGADGARRERAPAAAAADHRDEIDEIVAGGIRARLVEAFGAARAGRLERRLGPLADLVRPFLELQEEAGDPLGGKAGDDVGPVVRAPVHGVAGVAAVVRDTR